MFSNSWIFFSVINPFLDWIGSHTAIVSIGLAWFTSTAAIKKYFQEQKTARLQKIYYEDAVIKPLERLDQLLLQVNKNSCLFSDLNQYIALKIAAVNQINEKMSKEDAEKNFPKTLKAITSSDHIQSLVKQIQTIDPVYSINNLSDILDKISCSSGRILKGWLAKITRDCVQIAGSIKTMAANYDDYLSVEQYLVPVNEAVLRRTMHINNLRLNILQNHIFLITLMSGLIPLMASKDYRTESSLIKSLQKDQGLIRRLGTMVEIFKILFCYYKIDDKYISYAMNASGSRYCLVFNKSPNNISVSIAEQTFTPENVKLVTLNTHEEITVAENSEAFGNLHVILMDIVNNKLNQENCDICNIVFRQK